MKACYYMIFGKRSNGKTFACQKRALERWKKDGSCVAIVRRWATDFKTKNAAGYWDGIVSEGIIKEITDGQYDKVFYCDIL